MLYDGDLHLHDRILTWLTSQDVFEIKNEIEEVNRKMLDKLLEENEFIATFFCMAYLSKDVRNKILLCCCNFSFGDRLQMNLIIRTVRWYWKNWRTLTVRQIIWILHLLKCPMPDMHENGVSPNCPQLFTSESDFQAYTEVQL